MKKTRFHYKYALVEQFEEVDVKLSVISPGAA